MRVKHLQKLNVRGANKDPKLPAPITDSAPVKLTSPTSNPYPARIVRKIAHRYPRTPSKTATHKPPYDGLFVMFKFIRFLIVSNLLLHTKRPCSKHGP